MYQYTLVNCIIYENFLFKTYAFDFVVALVASWSNETLEAIFAVKLTFLLYETDVLKMSTTLRVDANKVLRAPDLTKSSDEWTPDMKKIVQIVTRISITNVSIHLFIISRARFIYLMSICYEPRDFFVAFTADWLQSLTVSHDVSSLFISCQKTCNARSF